MIKVIAQALGLGVAQLPMANCDGVNPRPIEDFIAVDIYDLCDRSCVNARQPPHALRELALGLIRVRTPTGPAAATQRGTVTEPGKGKLCFLISVGWIFGGVLHLVLVCRGAPYSLPGLRCAEQTQRGQDRQSQSRYPRRSHNSILHHARSFMMALALGAVLPNPAFHTHGKRIRAAISLQSSDSNVPHSQKFENWSSSHGFATKFDLGHILIIQDLGDAFVSAHAVNGNRASSYPEDGRIAKGPQPDGSDYAFGPFMRSGLRRKTLQRSTCHDRS